MIRADRSLCGCGGKPAFDDVVYPALQKVQNNLQHVEIATSEVVDAGKIPLSTDLTRSLQFTTQIDTTKTINIDRDTTEQLGQWALTVTLSNKNIGASSEKLGDFLLEKYQNVISEAYTQILKGHTVQIKGSSDPIHFFEWFDRCGEARDGYWIVNVDIIHALPTFSPTDQARIATLNSLNDCYTTGAHTNRTIRPFCFYPRDQDVTEAQVTEWYIQGCPQSISTLPSTVIPYGGQDWLFGASAVSEINHEPATFIHSVTSNDQVLVHRPLGALALIRYGLDGKMTIEKEKRVQDVIRQDNQRIAEIISNFCPAYQTELDPSKHVKYVTDISGAGIQGVNQILNIVDTHLRVENLPLIDREQIKNAQARWTVPDATIETNGPLVMIGEPSVIRQISKHLSRTESSMPQLLGSVVSGKGAIESRIDLGPYIEYFVRE